MNHLTDDYDTEVTRMHDTYGEEAEIPTRRVMAPPLTPAAPVHDHIRQLSQDVVEAADILAERRQASLEAGLSLEAAEKRFKDVSTQLEAAMERHRQDGPKTQNILR